MTEKEIKLKSDKIELIILPTHGAGLKSFTYTKGNKETIEILKPSEDKINSSEYLKDFGGYFLIPYSGEIKDDAFIYWGIKRKVITVKNERAFNGDVWKKSWNILEQTENKVCLEYKHDVVEGFPYPYTVQQKIEIDGNKVIFEIKITNDFELPMPFGIGYKPYFKKSKEMAISCRNRNVWSHEGLLSISKPYKTPSDWDFERLTPLKDMEFDTCFGGFDGKITVQYPEEQVRVTFNCGADFNHLFIYNKKENDFINIIPSTNAQDAFNVAAKGIIGSGIKTLEPNETNSDIFEFIITEE